MIICFCARGFKILLFARFFALVVHIYCRLRFSALPLFFPIVLLLCAVVRRGSSMLVLCDVSLTGLSCFLSFSAFLAHAPVILHDFGVLLRFSASR